MQKWTNEEIEILKQNYNKFTLKEIHKKFLSHKSFGYMPTLASKLKLYKRSYTSINEDFFKEPNIYNCQIAGFIAADGCITTNNRLVINLSCKDFNYLQKIANQMNFIGKLHIRTKYNNSIIGGRKLNFTGQYCALHTWRTNKISEYLKKYWSIVPRKTLILEPPNLQDVTLILSFLSGYIDGDGVVGFYKTKSNIAPKSLRITVLGTKMLLTWIKNFLDNLIPVNKKADLIKKGKIYYYAISGSRAYILSKMILSLPILRMDRKWNNAKEYINTIESTLISKEKQVELNKIITLDIINFLNQWNINIPSFIKNPSNPKINLSFPPSSSIISCNNDIEKQNLCLENQNSTN